MAGWRASWATRGWARCCASAPWPAGTDFAIRFVRATWKYHGITAELLAEHLAGLPAKLDHVAELAAEGVIGGEEPNVADLQIASSIALLLTFDDIRPLLAGRPAEELARRLFPDFPGHTPPTLPAEWLASLAAPDPS